MHLPTRTRATAALVAAAAAGALVVGSPVGADAARLITGKDVKNNSITGKDVKNGSLRAKDFKAGQLPAGRNGTNGVDGRSAPQPTVVSFTGSITTVDGQNAVARRSVAQVPASSLVQGLSVSTTPSLATACPGGYNAQVVTEGFPIPVVAESKIGTDPVERGGLPSNVVGAPTSLVFNISTCRNASGQTIAVPSLTFDARIAYTTITGAPTVRFDQSTAVAADDEQPLRSSGMADLLQ